jgi:hypothetical protein
MVLTYFLNDFEMVPVATIITGITLVFTFHIRCLLFLLLLLLFVFVFYCQDSFCTAPTVIIMTSFISTLVDLWNTE